MSDSIWIWCAAKTIDLPESRPPSSYFIIDPRLTLPALQLIVCQKTPQRRLPVLVLVPHHGPVQLLLPCVPFSSDFPARPLRRLSARGMCSAYPSPYANRNQSTLRRERLDSHQTTTLLSALRTPHEAQRQTPSSRGPYTHAGGSWRAH